MRSKKTFPGILKIVLHCTVFILAIIILPLLVAYFSSHSDPYRIFGISTIFVSIFYLNYYIFIPRFISKRKFKSYAISVILLVLLAQTLLFELKPDRSEFRRFNEMRNSEEFQKLQERKSPRIFLFYLGNFILCIIPLAVSTSVLGTREWLIKEKRIKEIENEKLTAELSYLKAQINPHFFFNTLNGIYALASHKSDQTPEVVLKLSNLMRYIIYDANTASVALAKELEHIEHYIDLQKIRINEKIKIKLSIEGNYEGFEIAPLLFSVFLENAFKHGIDYTQGGVIDVKIHIEQTRLFFMVKNPIAVKISSIKYPKQSGIGLKNIRKRLKLIYPNQHRLNIYQVENHYIVELYLKLPRHEVPNN